MLSYTVKPGDTLFKIAAGKLGSAGKWRIIAEMNGLINTAKIRVGQHLMLPSEAVEVPAVVHTAEGVRRVSNDRIRITVEHGIVYATSLAKPEKVFIGRLHRKGLNRVSLSAARLARAGEPEEQRIINNYLEIRESYGKRPMPDARPRANVIRGYVVDGIISTARDSFISGRTTASL